MREKRYYKDMKGTQEQKKERVGGFEEDGAKTEYVNTLELFFFGIGRKEREGKGDNKGSFCRSGARIGGNGKRKLYNGF